MAWREPAKQDCISKLAQTTAQMRDHTAMVAGLHCGIRQAQGILMLCIASQQVMQWRVSAQPPHAQQAGRKPYAVDADVSGLKPRQQASA